MDYFYDERREYKMKLRKKRQFQINLIMITVLLLVTSTVLFIAGTLLKRALNKYDAENGTAITMSYSSKSANSNNPDSNYFNQNEFFNAGYNTSDIPEQLIDFMERRPETTDFVMSYPAKHDAEYYIDLSKEVTDGEIPLLIQWDERWGYKQYGDDFFALNGCGPTCLSMVCLGLGGDTKYDPYTVGQLMEQNDYYEYGVGSKWSMMTDGASLIGLYGEEISLDEYVIRNKLNSGCPIICSMGEGDFTTTGHFIVLTGINADGTIKVNDPCSRINSAKTWELSTLIPQIKNLWAFSLK